MTESIVDAYRRHWAEYERLYEHIEGFRAEWKSGRYAYSVTTVVDDGVFVRLEERWDDGLSVWCVDCESLPTLIDALVRAKAHLDQPATTPSPTAPQPGESPSTQRPTDAGH